MPKLAAQIIDTESPPENVGAGATFGVPGGTGLPGTLNPVIGGFGGIYEKLPAALAARRPSKANYGRAGDSGQ